MLGTVEAMFEYLDKVEDQLGSTGDSESDQRASLGLPRYRFVDRSCLTPVLACGAQAKFVFLGTAEAKKRAAAVDLRPGSGPAATVDDPETCRQKGLCFPNLVRQEFRLCDQDLVVTRNVAPYGRNHGVVRSRNHEPQSLCFEPFRLAIALSVARALGSERGRSDYEVWVAGEGFNTQWHFHVQFRKQRNPVWEFVDTIDEDRHETRPLEDYPSRPAYFDSNDGDQLIGTLHHEIWNSWPNARSQHLNPSSPFRPATGLLLSYEESRWRVILVKSWYQPGERLFGKQPGLHEHLGEVILESDEEFERVQRDPSAAARILEQRLRQWCQPPA